MSAIVGVVMGSSSDYEVMAGAMAVLSGFGVEHEVRVVSAHRTPDDMLAYGRDARSRGLRVLIAGAGGAAHLPGMLASTTSLPVIGVPVATVAVNGAANAALLAVRVLATGDDRLAAALDEHRRELADEARAQDAGLGVNGDF